MSTITEIIHSKIKLLSLFIDPHVCSNPVNDSFFCVAQKILSQCFLEVSGVQLFGYRHTGLGK